MVECALDPSAVSDARGLCRIRWPPRVGGDEGIGMQFAYLVAQLLGRRASASPRTMSGCATRRSSRRQGSLRSFATNGHNMQNCSGVATVPRGRAPKRPTTNAIVVARAAVGLHNFCVSRWAWCNRTLFYSVPTVSRCVQVGAPGGPGVGLGRRGPGAL